MRSFLDVLRDCVLGLEVYVYLKHKETTFTSENWIQTSVTHQKEFLKSFQKILLLQGYIDLVSFKNSLTQNPK